MAYKYLVHAARLQGPLLGAHDTFGQAPKTSRIPGLIVGLGLARVGGVPGHHLSLAVLGVKIAGLDAPAAAAAQTLVPSPAGASLRCAVVRERMGARVKSGV